ncbi:uncharacterized protein F4807DRAFT_463811 [Annulohypoxylon truncatum]|uniref:uncharacterized protein n=1 Tax=Annulohypoxylon truncatum TaxID=327061 RepID=UPI002007327B|nr:uncharacterized protein F4807DRAFT_463811 [Annulohypoxylon truncatum]KAI1206322.1 hypothetical protein F4807DRAFT_463811 [Annulohypoxylon truncatum]
METVHDQIQSLITKLSVQCSANHGFGFMSPSIYDTAWVSMVRKPNNAGEDEWLFPECFEFILASQLPSGAWESYASHVDGILNTSASLLALRKRLEICPGNLDWETRSKRAEIALRELLDKWDADLSDQVGFEMLIIQLVSLLEGRGIVLEFPQLNALKILRNAKLKRLPLSSVCNAPSTLYHCLEGLIGHIDFEQVRHRRDANGSMMGSPSSTAAYLMHSSVWDDEAEAYLRNVLKYGTGNGNGSVPSAWPTRIFETTWAITTLAESGVEIDSIETCKVGDFLQKAMSEQEGTLGFDIGSFPDADDTAKGIMTLRILGESPGFDGLIEMFEAEEHFRTYHGERNPSFSANCNVLTCLLTAEDPTLYISQIAKITRFLTTQVYQDGVIDKWHRKELYWMMLLTRAFEVLSSNEELLRKLVDLVPDLREDIPMVTIHLLIRILKYQLADGSWEQLCEVTSYAILALISLARLPWIQQIDLGEITAAIARGKSFLLSKRTQWAKGHYLWIEKVTYASDVLSEAYCLAAVSAPVPPVALPLESEASAFTFPGKKMRVMMKKTAELIARTPLLSNTEPYVLRAAEMQACYALAALQRRPLSIFPRTAKGEDKYLCIIPLAFTACAAVQGCGVSLSVLREMMVLSILNFLADEYMEGVIEKGFVGNLGEVRNLIQQVFVNNSEAPCTNGTSNGIVNGEELSLAEEHSHERSGDRASLHDVNKVIRKFVSHILHHPTALSAPRSYQTRLAFELETFLLAHLAHAEDNHRFGHQYGGLYSTNGENGLTANGSGMLNGDKAKSQGNPIMQYVEPKRTFYNWVRSTSADHTSCPFSFVFFNCLIHAFPGPENADIYASAKTAYLTEDLCRHLASLCRMYNDWGSLRRDADECNLNSVNFPEFHSTPLLPSQSTGKEECAKVDEKRVKSELLWIAEYERRGLQTSLALLEEELGSRGKRTVDALKLFVNVTDLYGQIYVLKDVGTRTK